MDEARKIEFEETSALLGAAVAATQVGRSAQEPKPRQVAPSAASVRDDRRARPTTIAETEDNHPLGKEKSSDAIPAEVSRRIAGLRFLLVAAMITVHALLPLPDAIGDKPGLYAFIQNVVTNVLGRCSVPLLCLFSGYLFFRGFDGGWRNLTRKLKNRTSTLLIPFLIWSGLTCVVFVVARTAFTTSQFVDADNPVLRELSVSSLVDAFFGIQGTPAAYHLWFIKNLILACCLAPLIYHLVRSRAGVLLCLAITWYWIAGYQIFEARRFEQTLAFFVWGAWLQVGRSDLCTFDHAWKPLGFLFITAALAFGATAFMPTEIAQSSMVSTAQRGIIALGCLAIWTAASQFDRWPAAANTLKRISVFSFFVFAAHEPLLTIIRKLSIRVFEPTSVFGFVGLYTFSWLAVLVACIAAASILRRWTPTLYCALAGKR